MSDTILCPVCETENATDATNCEVCGERLTPPAPGEVLSPEENVSAFLADGGDATEAGDLGMPELPDSEAEYVANPVASVEPTEIPVDAGPEFLYSSLDGTPFAAGTPEFEDGFGPMGEELVAEPPVASPELASDVSEVGEASVVEDEVSSFEAPVDDASVSSNTRASAAFAAAFPVREKERVAVAPLPQPGVHVEPATLTLYVNRAPVHSHAVETDETLLGRRDPMADAYPDFDLTEWDADGEISRKHAYVYRQNRNYQLYVLSNAGTQLNAEMLALGDRRALKSGDVIVLAGKYALKFELPAE